MNKHVNQINRINRNTQLIISYLKANNLDKNSYWSTTDSNCASIPWEIIRRKLDKMNKRSDWMRLSTNPIVTWEIVCQNLDKPWDWNSLSSNPNITCEIVSHNLDKPWDWYNLSKHPNITWTIVQQNPDMPWNWNGLCRNPNLNWLIIAENLDKLPDFTALLKVISIYDEETLGQAYKYDIMAKRIQRAFRESIMNPSYTLCRNRLLREFDEMKEDMK